VSIAQLRKQRKKDVEGLDAMRCENSEASGGGYVLKTALEGPWLFETFPFGEKHSQRMPWILIGANQTMGHFQGAEEFFVCGHECIKAREILLASGLGINGPARASFEVLENIWILKRKFQFVAIENLEDDYFVAMEAKLFEPERDVFGRLKEIGKEQNDASTMDQANGVLNELRKARAAGGLKIFKFAQDESELVGTLGRADETRSRTRGEFRRAKRTPHPNPLPIGWGEGSGS